MNAGLLIAGAAALLLFSKGGPAMAGSTSSRIPIGGGRTIDARGVIRDAAGRVVGQGTPTQYAQQLARLRSQQGQSPDQTIAEIRAIAGLTPAVVKSIEALVGLGTASVSKLVDAIGGTSGTPSYSDAEIAALRDAGLTTETAVAEIAATPDVTMEDFTDWTLDDPMIADIRDSDLTTDMPSWSLPDPPVVDFGPDPVVDIIGSGDAWY